MHTESFIPEVTTEKKPEDSDLFFVFQDRKMLVRDTGENLLPPSRTELTPVWKTLKDRLYIGAIGDTACYVSIGEQDSVPEGYLFSDLRSVFFKSKPELRPALSTAALVRDWVVNTRFCGRCGAKTSRLGKEWCSSCPDCGHVTYPRMSPAVIVAVLKEGKILLAHNHRFVAGYYSLVAGFVEPGESFENAVHREILEETGLRVKNLRYFSSQCWPFPDSMMAGFVAEYDSGELKLNEELTDAKWFDKDSIPHVPDKGPISRRIIDWYLETGGDGVLPEETER